MLKCPDSPEPSLRTYTNYYMDIDEESDQHLNALTWSLQGGFVLVEQVQCSLFIML